MNKLQMILRQLIILGLLLLGLSGCTFPNPSMTPTKLPPDYNRWLRKEPCAAPCWEGLTPGITTYGGATKQLRQNDAFTRVEVILPDRITWQRRGWVDGGFAEFDISSGEAILKLIVVDLPQPIKLKDVMDVYGNPSHIQVFADEDMHEPDRMLYSMELYFVPAGLFFMFDNPDMNGGIKTVITPESEINAAFFYAPSMQGLQNALQRAKHLIPWQGTFDFDTYCKLTYLSEVNYRCK